jgi:hypothetical protein
MRSICQKHGFKLEANIEDGTIQAELDVQALSAQGQA